MPQVVRSIRSVSLVHFCTFILASLMFGLPLHGALTVFGPDWIRWWKELLLAILILVWAFSEGKHILNKKIVQLKVFEKLSIAFLFWLLVLVSGSEDILTGAASGRYLGLGFIVFLITSRLKGMFPDLSIKVILRAFIVGILTSTVFGLWAHFFGGYDLLQHFYSQTISSWVPGQIIPLYHETGSFIRLQGASSGPVEYGHLVFLALVSLPLLHWRNKTVLICAFILLVGLALSLTRGAWGACLIYGILCGWNWQKDQKNPKKYWIIILSMGVLLVASLFSVPSLRHNILARAGTQDHFIKPIEVLKLGFEHPFVGNIGSVGPAARAKNLRERNDDKAPIAENVFIDIFAQTGIIGLFLVLFFWASFLKHNPVLFPIITSAFVAANMATIFDMAPISMTFFLVFALLSDESAL